jgi:type IV pilus assembly protein PilC
MGNKIYGKNDGTILEYLRRVVLVINPWVQTMRFKTRRLAKPIFKLTSNWWKRVRRFFQRYKSVLNRVGAKEKIFFTKRLSFLVSSGIPLSDSLALLTGKSNSPYFNSVINSLLADVLEGHDLSRALERYRDQFGDFAINIIRFGESSGTLASNLEYLAIELKKRELLRKKIIGAALYPAIVIIGVFAVVGFLVVYLFPKILPVFSSLHIKLPLSTRLLIYVSTVIRQHGLLLISACVALVLVVRWLPRKYYGVRIFMARLKIRTPIIGNITRSYNLASITRTLGLLLKSGLTLSESVSIAIRSTENELYRLKLISAEKAILQGQRFSEYLDDDVLFPNVIVGVLATGERSGNLSESFIYLAELFEEEVEDITKNISSLIEPVLMVCMGVVVGFIAVSIISPIYGITSNLHAK